MPNNDLYQELKQQGLVLSEGTEILLPPIQPPKPTLLSSLASYIIPQQPIIPYHNYNLILVPIMNNCFIIGRSNTLIYYKYNISQDSSRQLVITRPYLTHLNFKIDRIHICDPKYLSDRGEIAFVVQAGNVLTLFCVDLKENCIIEGGSVSYAKIQSVRFICEKELIVVSSNGPKVYVHHCFIVSGKIKERKKIPFEFDNDMEKLQVLQKIVISGNIDEQQQSTVCVFYLSVLKDDKERKKRMEQQLFASEENSQIFRVKEFQRDLNGNLTAKNIYKVFSTNDRKLLPQNYEITSYDNFYCITGNQQIIIIKKKFDRYLVMDNVVQKMGCNSLKLHPRGIVTSQNAFSMELKIVQFNDPKCNNRMLDSFEVPEELASGFMLLWPFKIDKDSSLIFVFKKEKKLMFCNLIKMDPIDKMLFVVENAPKEKIPMIQEIAVNLGISKKEFYVSQWQHSKRQHAEIHHFLLPCGDIPTIKKQLRSALRKKKLEVSKFLQILQKLSKIIKQQLEQNLSQDLLREYIKNDFLRRKIKLKHADWRMDYRELDRIYNGSLVDMFVQIVKSKLYPEQQEKDPLHVMVQATIKQKLQLKHVFQVFRISILQNYTSFLINFVSSFRADQIVNVFENYYELLPVFEFNPDLVVIKPEYETEVELKEKLKEKHKEKPNIQEQQFSNITSVEFWREMSKERLEKELHDFYPTSKINQAINKLCTSDFGQNFMLHKHCLITCTMQEYTDKLKDISGIKLYLKLCERVNQQNLNSRDQKTDLSKQLIQIFKKNNNLTGKAYETVRLYSSLHRFMLQNNFSERNKITTDELVVLRDENLVALFFLENKQRKEFIFEGFRDIFVELYKGPTQFNEVIKKFIDSQNCSRIELEIFIDEIKSKPKQFQDDNQQLIEIIIDGFCKKLQLREQNDTQRFIDIMLQMPLIKRLNLKITKMLSIRECLHVFMLFNCEKQSYYKILTLQQNNQIFRLLLDRYFNNQIKSTSIMIDQDMVTLEYCRNMLTVLFYLQEYVYYQVSEEALLLTYCQVLVEWKQYEVIMGIVHQQGILQEFSIEIMSFIDKLVHACLSKIYTDQQIQFTQQTKDHIRNILQLYGQQHNQTKRRQYAKLQLAQIFQQWGTNVYTHDIHLVVTQWQQGKREVFIKDLINSYIKNLSFETLVNLYQHLEMAAREATSQEVVRQNGPQEFINYALYFAERLLHQKHYQEISKIIAYVKGSSNIQMSYALISQTFLKCLTKKYFSSQSIQSGKQAIEYFTQYFDQGQQIQQIFESLLQSTQFQYMSGQKIDRIVVDQVFCFRKEYVQMSTEMLWQVAYGLFGEREGNVELLYYSYYFLLMIFRYPEHGFKVSRISFSLQALTELMFRLQAKIDENAQLWHINVYSLFKKFLRSMYLEGLSRIKQVNSQMFHSQFTQRVQQSHLEMINTRLKQDREINLQLLKCISRIQQYIAQYKAVRKLQRQSKFERLILEEQKQKEIKEREQRIKKELLRLQQQQGHNNDDDQQKITISLKKFNYLRKNVSFQSSVSHLVTEKQIAEQIYALEKEEKKRTQHSIPVEKGDFLKKLSQHEKLPKFQQRSLIDANMLLQQQFQGGGINFMQALQQGMQEKFNPMNYHAQQLQPSMQQMTYYPPPNQQPITNPFSILAQSQGQYFSSQYEDPLQQRIFSILQDINNQQFDSLQSTFRREQLTMAAERMFYSSEYSFSYLVKIMAKMGVIDQRKLSVCLVSNMYLENKQFLIMTDDELKRLYPFNYLITPSTHFQYEFTQRMFRVMMEAFFPIIETKATFFIVEFANYVGHVLGDETYTGHFLVEVLVPLLRGGLNPEIMSRISLIFDHLAEFPHQVKYHMQLIQGAFSANPQNQSVLEQYHQKFIGILQNLDREGSHKRGFSGNGSHDAEFTSQLMMD